MPDCFVGPFDKYNLPGTLVCEADRVAGDARPPQPSSPPFNLPTSGLNAVVRGLKNRCPSCGETRLFARFLKPIAQCAACKQDWTPQQADDFPAYVSILLTGHLMAPLIIALVSYANLPMWVLMTVIMALATGMMIVMLQPAKGAIIATQWWLGMHGFVKAARPAAAGGADIAM